MSEQDNGKVATLQRPTTNDLKAWKAYWETQEQSWRTEPEIDAERQKYLAERRNITPDIKQGIYPFKDIKLSRADIEWLLAKHENGRGPVDWGDPTQRGRSGLDLRGADLRDKNLEGLPLARLQGGLAGNDWMQATVQQRHLAAIHLEEAILTSAHLEGSILTHAHLQGALLQSTHLESVDAFQICLAGEMPANLRYTYFDTSTKLEEAKIANEEHVGPRLLDIHWGETSLTAIDWSSVRILSDEQRARDPKTFYEKLKGQQENLKYYQQENLRYYQEATRAYHQLAVILQQQGMTEDAARFFYRAQKLQRIVLRRQKKFGQYLFSLFLDLLSGYGLKPVRWLLVYLGAILVFAVLHYIAEMPHPTVFSALTMSILNLHGRPFLNPPTGPQGIIDIGEAFVGLIIEAVLIAIITRRILGK